MSGTAIVCGLILVMSSLTFLVGYGWGRDAGYDQCWNEQRERRIAAQRTVQRLRAIPCDLMDANDEAPQNDYWGGYFAALHRVNERMAAAPSPTPEAAS